MRASACKGVAGKFDTGRNISAVPLSVDNCLLTGVSFLYIQYSKGVAGKSTSSWNTSDVLLTVDS